MKLSLLTNLVQLLEDTFGPGSPIILNATISVRHPAAEKLLGLHPYWGSKLHSYTYKIGDMFISAVCFLA